MLKQQLFTLLKEPPRWLLLLTGIIAASLFIYQSLTPSPQQLSPSDDALQATTPSNKDALPPLEWSQRIGQHPLFGVKEPPPTATPPTQPPAKVVEVRKSNYALTGLLFVEQPQADRRAFLTIDQQQERSFKAGDSLPGGGKLLEIHANRVNLENHGQITTLFLPKAESVTPATAAYQGYESAPSPADEPPPGGAP